MQQNLDIQDGSGDKEFFTIVPNYILNHSTAIDQALYLQMKRLAGDGRKEYCYPSFRYLQKQLGVGATTLRKSIKYLVEHKWIDNLGKRQVHTSGGMQWVNAYKINNIWDLNSKEYKGVSKQTPLNKGVSKNAKGVSENEQGVSSVLGITRTYKELKKDNSSFKSKKPFCVSANLEARFSKGKWWALPKNGGAWLEVTGGEKDIIYK